MSSHGLASEQTPLPLSTNRNELDLNYENMIENLLLQQVLLYTRERSKASRRIRSPLPTTNSLLVRQQFNPPPPPTPPAPIDHHLALKTSLSNAHDEEPTLCLIESHEKNSSDLIENILDQYNQRQENHSRFDQNLMELIIKRNRQRRQTSTSINNGHYFRLQ